MSQSTVRQDGLAVLASPPTTLGTRSIVLSAALLTALLAFAVPLLVLAVGIPTLVAVVLAGVGYGAFLLATGTLFEGAFAAVFVLATFAADLPLPVFGVPRGGAAGVLHPEFFLVDVVALPLAALFAYWWRADHSRGLRSLFATRGARLIAASLAALVVWSFLSALVGNGPSRFAALFWAFFQLRYLLVFGVAAVIARRVGIRPPVYVLLIAVSGHVLVAIAQSINGDGFGLTKLGDYMLGATNSFALAGLTIPTGMYAGGFAGTVRVLAGVVLLCAPLLVVLVMDGTRVRRALAAVALAAFVFVLRIANSDAGVGAFVVSLLVLAAGLVALAVRGRPWRADDHSLTDSALGGAALVGAFLLTFVLYQVHDSGPAKTTSGAAASTTAQAISALPLVSGSYLTTRVNQYAAALDIASQYPLFGIGGLNFTLISSQYGLPHALPIHSAYFGYLAAAGIVGLVLFLVVFVGVAVMAAWNAFVRARVPPSNRPLWAGLAAGLLGFAAFVFWVVQHNGSVSFSVLFLLTGIVVGVRPVDSAGAG